MKKIFLLLSLILCFLLNIPNLKFIKVEAIGFFDREFIGTYYEVERVNERTRVNVTGDALLLAVEAGRDVTITTTGPIFPPGGPIRPLSTLTGSEVGYYYATPSDGKIVCKHDLYNDLDSVLTMLRIVHQEASLRFYDETTEVINNVVLEYVRSFNPNYSSSLWDLVAGNTGCLGNLISFINQLVPDGIAIKDFFASFNLGGNYNGVCGAVSSTFTDKQLYLINPVSNVPNIDLLHFFASFDANCFSTGMGTDLFDCYETRSIASMASWAGDLQTLCAEFHDSDDFSFNSALVSSTFSLYDLYSDIDAYVSSFYFHLEDDDLTIWECISNYYNGLTQSSRFLNFVNCVSNDYGENLIHKREEFTKKVYFMVKIDENGNEIIFDENVIILIGNTFHFNPLYSLMEISPFTYPSLSVRKNIADQFVDYIFERI